MVDKAVLNFIIDTAQPFRIVEEPSFKKLVCLGLPDSLAVMSRKTVSERLNKDFERMKLQVKEELKKIDVVATTTDLWSKAKRYFHRPCTFIQYYYLFNLVSS